MKLGPNDVKLTVLITGHELHELKRFTIDMAEAFGLDRRIEAYSGKRPIGFYRWDLDCLLAVMALALKDQCAYPDKTSSGYAALKRLRDRLQEEYRRTLGMKEADRAAIVGAYSRSARRSIVLELKARICVSLETTLVSRTGRQPKPHGRGDRSCGFRCFMFQMFQRRASVRATVGAIEYRRIPMALGETNET